MNQELKTYIENALRVGMTRETITTTLLASGWNKADIDGVFDLVVPIAPKSSTPFTEKVSSVVGVQATPLTAEAMNIAPASFGTDRWVRFWRNISGVRQVFALLSALLFVANFLRIFSGSIFFYVALVFAVIGFWPPNIFFLCILLFFFVEFFSKYLGLQNEIGAVNLFIGIFGTAFIWLGFVAGFLTEGVKYAMNRKNPINSGRSAYEKFVVWPVVALGLLALTAGYFSSGVLPGLRTTIRSSETATAVSSLYRDFDFYPSVNSPNGFYFLNAEFQQNEPILSVSDVKDPSNKKIVYRGGAQDLQKGRIFQYGFLDDDRVWYETRDGVFVVQWDGANTKTLVSFTSPPFMGPVLSPDRKRFVYWDGVTVDISRKDLGFRIIDVDTGIVTLLKEPLTDPLLTFPNAPTLSGWLDNSTLLFSAENYASANDLNKDIYKHTFDLIAYSLDTRKATSLGIAISMQPFARPNLLGPTKLAFQKNDSHYYFLKYDPAFTIGATGCASPDSLTIADLSSATKILTEHKLVFDQKLDMQDFFPVGCDGRDVQIVAASRSGSSVLITKQKGGYDGSPVTSEYLLGDLEKNTLTHLYLTEKESALIDAYALSSQFTR